LHESASLMIARIIIPIKNGYKRAKIKEELRKFNLPWAIVVCKSVCRDQRILEITRE